MCPCGSAQEVPWSTTRQSRHLTPPPPIYHVRACLELAEVTRCHLARGREEVLVRWIGQVAADATWVALDEFPQDLSSFSAR
jgi:hypothetical protein